MCVFLNTEIETIHVSLYNVQCCIFISMFLGWPSGIGNQLLCSSLGKTISLALTITSRPVILSVVLRPRGLASVFLFYFIFLFFIFESNFIKL